MTLARLAAEAGISLDGDGAVPVTGFAIDHRKVAPGTVFGAFPGSQVNGEDFIPAAVAGGAVAVVARRGVSVSGALHIVDDELYVRALANIASLLKPGGLLIWSDNFIHRPTARVTHQVSRSLDEITAAVDRAGFTIECRVPMFVLMNYPADASRLAGLAWTAMVSPAMVSNALGGLVGAVLYPFERRLVRWAKESPSTELMVCRRG